MSITITGGFTLASGGWTITAAPLGIRAIFGYGYATITGLVSLIS